MLHSEIMFIITGMAVVTYFTRFACLALFSRRQVPGRLEKWLKHMPTAILTALIAPAILLPRGNLDISTDNHYLLAGCVAAIVAYKSRSVIATMGLGLAVIFILRWLDY